MSVKIVSGNIFTSDCQTIVNTVNCVGVMGAGIAFEYRLRYPEMHNKYVKLCSDKKIDVGLLWLYKSHKKWVLNFPTKKHWKYPSKKEYLHAGLKKFSETYVDKGIKSIAFPLLGADKGCIPPEESISIMKSYLDKIDLNVEIYKYDPKAKDDLYDGIKKWMLSQDVNEISQKLKLKKCYVEKVINGINHPDVFQLSQLVRIDGVGIKTLEKIFIFASEEIFSINQKLLFND